MSNNQDKLLFNIEKITDQIGFCDKLFSYIKDCKAENSEIVILCIGTDRATGDCLGPLVGHKLNHSSFKKIGIFGTLEKPVHAKNLADTLDYIENFYVNPFIIAIDACLGSIDHIGYVGFDKGPLKPGAGVNKQLPSVGDLSITGIVNFSGIMDMVILQNTRLNLVMKMADFIVFAIKSALWKFEQEESPLIKAVN